MPLTASSASLPGLFMAAAVLAVGPGCIEPITADLYATLDLQANDSSTAVAATVPVDLTENDEVNRAAAWVRTVSVNEIEVTIVNVGDDNTATTISGEVALLLEDGTQQRLGDVSDLPVVFAESTFLAGEEVDAVGELLESLAPFTLAFDGEVDQVPLDFDLLFRFSIWAN